VVHKLAKEVIIDWQNIYLFPHMEPLSSYKRHYIAPFLTTRFNKQGVQVSLQNIEQEVRRWASDYQPDITAEIYDEPFIIEIFYRHPVDEEKLQKIIRDDIAAVEVSLGHLDANEITPSEIRQAIVNPKNFKWLYYPRRWLSGDELQAFSGYEEAEKKKIDDKLEAERLERERIALERENKERERQEKALKDTAITKSHIVQRLVKEYYLLHLQNKRVSPFTPQERKQMAEIFPWVDRAHNIILRATKDIDEFPPNVPDRAHYENLMKGVGYSYRSEIAQRLVEKIDQDREWEEHLVNLYKAGFREIRQLAPLDELETKSLDELVEDGDEISIYLKLHLLPYCNNILNKHFPEGSHLRDLSET